MSKKKKSIVEIVTSKKKKQKYQKNVRVIHAGDIAKFLIYNGKNFKVKYNGKSLYTFEVASDDKSFLDGLLDRLK